MRSVSSFFLCSVLAFTACGGEEGGGPGSDSPFRAKIDGAAFASQTDYSVVPVMVQLAGLYILSGFQTGADGSSHGITISLMNVPGPGTYPLGTGAGVSGGTAIVTQNGAGWGTQLTGAAGTITLDVVTADRIAGTFSFTAEAVSGGATGSKTITDGVFDLPLTTIGDPGTVPERNQNRIRATIADEAFAPSTVALQTMPSFAFGFAAVNDRYIMSFAIQDITGPGTYSIAMGSDPIVAFSASRQGGALTTWSNSSASASGAVVISTLTDLRATGTFEVTLGPDLGPAPQSPLVITGGTFDIGLPDR